MGSLSNSTPYPRQVYGDLVVLVPEWLREHSEGLLTNQKHAIDLGAVSATNVNHLTNQGRVGWAFKNPVFACCHLNIPPIEKERLYCLYPTYFPLSLVERHSLVVGGVFAVPLAQCYFLPTWDCDLSAIKWDPSKRYSEDHFVCEQR
jgi:hypothetical protein